MKVTKKGNSSMEVKKKDKKKREKLRI